VSLFSVHIESLEGKMADDEEPVDQKIEVIDTCKATKCAIDWEKYMSCAKRIEGHSNPEANCTSWYLDFWKCADECGKNELFKRLV
jgi:hypothetical protein